MNLKRLFSFLSSFLTKIWDQLQKLVEVLKNYPSVNLFLGA